MVSWREREARNEARFRTPNEWVEIAGAEDFALLAFVCECGDSECARTIMLTAAEDGAVRPVAPCDSQGTWLVTLHADHDLATRPQLVQQTSSIFLVLDADRVRHAA